MEILKAKKLMSTRLLTVPPSMGLRELVEFLRDNRIHGALVEDGERLIGVVSYSDILVHLSEEAIDNQHGFSRLFVSDDDEDRLAPMLESLGAVAVRDVMTPSVVSCDVGCTAGEVAGLMRRHNIHRVVVTDKNKAVGLLSATDLLAALAQYEKALAGEHAK